MASIDGAQVYWEPGPAPKPIRGLFDVAEVVNYTDPHMGLGVEYMHNRCLPAQAWYDFCSPQSPKTFYDFRPAYSRIFTVYDGSKCLVGLSRDEQESAMRESFDVKAEAVAEFELKTLIEEEGQGLLPSTLVELVASADLALAPYAGRGLLHMTRHASIHASSQNLFQTVESNTAQVQTINGTPVVLGRGYSTSNSNWVGATGRVVVLRGPVVTAYAPPSSAKPEPRLLIEQPHVLLVECVLQYGTEAPA